MKIEFTPGVNLRTPTNNERPYSWADLDPIFKSESHTKIDSGFRDLVLKTSLKQGFKIGQFLITQEFYLGKFTLPRIRASSSPKKVTDIRQGRRCAKLATVNTQLLENLLEKSRLI